MRLHTLYLEEREGEREREGNSNEGIPLCIADEIRDGVGPHIDECSRINKNWGTGLRHGIRFDIETHPF